MKIILSPDLALRQKSEEITLDELPKMAKIAEKMAKLMYKFEGCGLAAPQVGVAKRMIVIDTTLPVEGEERPQDPIFLLNPKITKLGDEMEYGPEGCLSIPGITVDIDRALYIELEAMDIDGSLLEISAEGFDARALQHEMDHLDGITMFEHLDAIARAAKLKEYDEALAAGAKPGDTSVDKDELRIKS